MARINIEDSLFTDSRWLNLVIMVGCQYKALGYLTKAWILAQRHWIEYGSIPSKAWPKEFDVLIDAEFADPNADGSVYIKGSTKAFAWLLQRSKAGKTVTPKRLDQLSDARLRKQEKHTERALNGTERKLNGSEPLVLVLPLSQSLDLTLAAEGGMGESEAPSATDLSRTSAEEPPSPRRRQAPPRGAIENLKGNPGVEHFLGMVTQKAQESWVHAYGDPEWVKERLGKAVAWIHSNPHKAPKSDFSKYLAGWLSRDWDTYRKTLKSEKASASGESEFIKYMKTQGDYT